MGGVVPKGEDNDELVDNLIEARYLKNPSISRIFRAVDRGDFFPGEYENDAYRDMAMRSGNLHMSAPCIYCSIMENIEFKPGLSFLNVGSGTGYLSTMAAQLLGPHDDNHGIELYQDAIDYANSKVEFFVRFCRGFDMIQFCNPRFVQGNIACLDTSFRQYDRVYVGARISNDKIKDHIKELVKVGGILIFPTEENLIKCTKINESEWEEESLLNVQFSDLIEKRPEDTENIRIYSQPWTLKELAREIILRNVIDINGTAFDYNREKIESLDKLPLPNVLIRYLKYYRDPNIPKPESTKKRRSSTEYDSDSSGDGDGPQIRFRVVIR